ncbi:MAG: hypothetical protein HYX57_01265 [Chloroflexi bacterium]|nr:hypothetical protein [Chloroflexota bacterium]
MHRLRILGRRTSIVLGIGVLAVGASAILVSIDGAPVAVFLATAVALAVLATLVGEGTDQVSVRLSPAATGILQSGLGNLPELFIAFFALQAGLVVVVQSALIGSILANSLLVLGIALTPVLVLLSILLGGAPLTLVVSPLLAAAVALSAVLTLVIVFDGESNWLEGLALIGLYMIIAASVWWGPAIPT